MKLIVFSLVAQLLGAFILAVRWVPEMGMQQGLFYAIFHAVSAFNNAGFSLFSNSMVDFVGDPLIIFTISALFIFGGLGFTVISDLRNNLGRGFKALNLHSKIMLTATPVLLIVGTLLFWFLEHHNAATLAELPVASQVAQAPNPQSPGTHDPGFLDQPRYTSP